MTQKKSYSRSSAIQRLRTVVRTYLLAAAPMSHIPQSLTNGWFYQLERNCPPHHQALSVEACATSGVSVGFLSTPSLGPYRAEW